MWYNFCASAKWNSPHDLLIRFVGTHEQYVAIMDIEHI